MVDNIKIAKALSDPIRYQIMQMLTRSETTSCCPVTSKDAQSVGRCNCEIMAELGMIQSRVSYHMKELLEAGLVIEEPQGKWKHYFINTKTIEEYIEQLNQDFGSK